MSVLTLYPKDKAKVHSLSDAVGEALDIAARQEASDALSIAADSILNSASLAPHASALWV